MRFYVWRARRARCYQVPAYWPLLVARPRILPWWRRVLARLLGLA